MSAIGIKTVIILASFLAALAKINSSTGKLPTKLSSFHELEVTAPEGSGCWAPIPPNISNFNSSIYQKFKAILSESRYQTASIKRFQEAIHVDTQVNDDYGDIENDNRWEKFHRFSAFLELNFPLVHKSLTLERINTHGLLYSWIPEPTNSGATLAKPILLMAHQDTVPVTEESLGDWKSDPFEGHIDENGIMYGRGVHDDKNSLISIVEAVELLLRSDFRPNRTVILAFGFDEEISGRRGALEISKFVEESYGKDGLEFILDEGPGIVNPIAPGDKIAYATVATAEKGYLDVLIEAKFPGGHSSLAGKHSLIGIVGEMLSSLENIDPFQPRISQKNPVLGYLACNSFGIPEVPRLVQQIQGGNLEAEYALGSLLENTSIALLSRTSQAIDIISGGQKINALPEQVSAGINYRIAPGLNLADVKQRIETILAPIAAKHDMCCSFFDGQVDDCSSGKCLRISQIGKALEPVDMAPHNSKVFSIVFGTVKSSLAQYYSKEMGVEKLEVVPTLMAGNTDTRHYWNLTANIFRFRPTRIDAGNNGGHTINEHIYAIDHFASVDFYASLILNANDL
ncbi:LADA_0E00364g1_1 [Lachancea dasiensis]|uniref:LADA_0E00364g1_1 n=1 Tax=Lachancea dasiensis TaxID=1072105 RepID=A0A1G4JAH3_9SACH|nr:LADA_0E00364g1_1 [Lachancea dasiensis]